MNERIDISEVARRTGLSVRALRFYEQRGIVQPLRSKGGRRVYGPSELARLNAAVALKRAGFSLADIATMLADRSIDLGPLIAGQLDAVEAEAAELAKARALLLSVCARIDAGEAIDVATLCALIRGGDARNTDMATIAARYLGEDARAAFTASWDKVPDGFDAASYAEAWRELGQRIEAALPLDPADPRAQAFVDQWFALLKPFADSAPPHVLAGVSRMYDDMDRWSHEADPGFSKAVWDFVRAAATHRMMQSGETR